MIERTLGQPGAAGALSAYLSSMRRSSGRTLVWAPALVLAGVLVEGAGIMLIVPAVDVLTSSATLPAWMEAAIGLVPLRREALLPAIMMALLVLLLGRGVVLWQRDQVMARLSLTLVDTWRERIVRALADADWSKLGGLRRSHIEFAVTADVARLAMGSDQILRAASSVLQLAVQLGLAFVLSPALALTAVALLLVLTPLIRPALRASHRHGGDLTFQGRKRHDAISDLMAGMKLAKAYDLQDRYVDDFVTTGSVLRERALHFSGHQLLVAQAFQLAGALAAVGMVMLGLYVTHTSPAVLSALLVLMARLSAPAMQLMQGMQAFALMLPAVAGLLAIERTLSTERAVGGGPPDAGSQPPRSVVERLNGEGAAMIRLEHVGHRHDSEGDDVLTAVELAIESGEFVLLMGASGGGKTTLADIVAGLIAPDRGRLSVDGIIIAGNAMRASWRRRTAYVPQDPLLFDCSIADNLRWAAPEATDDVLWQALETVEAAGFVRALPEGLATKAGDRGMRLSGGERQRICIARALLRAPRLLIMDEATSALDAPTEARLLRTLRDRTSVTVLFVSHRRPHPGIADRVIVLERGALVEVEVDAATRPRAVPQT